MLFTSVASFAYDTIKCRLEKTHSLHIPAASIKACVLFLVHFDFTGMRENSFSSCTLKSIN